MDWTARARRRRSARFPLRAACVACLLVLAGCAAPSHLPPAPPPAPPAPPPRPAPGYERLADSLAAVDASGLAGRRIALDPGHGGFFRGALGVNCLSEAEVNLGVALRLRDWLEAHGAIVFLTRDTDRDFLTPADSSLHADLDARVRLANGFAPDLFLSIHHNADPGGAHDVNETQTYYKLGDDGPSLDAAQDVHRALVRNVGIATQKVVPGNFFVLRNSDGPALLTETSHITDPDVETRLALPEKQELEADALFIGLARYFARPLPVIEEFVVRSVPGSRVDTLFRPDERVAVSARLRGAFDLASLRLDGEPLPLERTGEVLRGTPPPLAAGAHGAALEARLSGAGAARARSLRFVLEKRPAAIAATAVPTRLGRGAGLLGVRAVVRDADGFILQEPVRLAMRALTPRIAPRETVVTTRDGVAWAYFRIARRRRADPAWAEIATGLFQAARRSRPAAPAHVLRVPRSAATSPWSGFVLGADGATPVAGAPGTAEPEPRVRWVNRDGFTALERDSTGAAAIPSLPGYRPLAPDSGATPAALPPRLVAIAGGALHGKRIALDPEGGGAEAAGVGAGGSRAAHLNLESARILAALLRAAGAEVRLTREGDLALSEVERVQTSEAFRAERFLRIGHRPEPPRLGYYAASAAGRQWAERGAQELARLGLPAPAVAEDAQYAIQQTSCTALYASPARIDDPAEEQRLLAPGTLRAEAWALFLALAREFAGEADWPLDSLEVRDGEGRPVAGAIVTLGGWLVLESDGLGRVRFARTEPGPLEAVVEGARVGARGVLLDSSRGKILTGAHDR